MLYPLAGPIAYIGPAFWFCAGAHKPVNGHVLVLILTKDPLQGTNESVFSWVSKDK